MQAYLDNIRAFLSRLTPGQQVGLAAVVLGTVALLAGIAYWSNQTDYALLFGRLEADDANRVVEALKTDGVKYEIKQNGTAIYVPSKQVHELRLRFAGEGFVSDGQVGYELFDTGTLGMTDFMQKLNLKRALEGELARTITNIKQVELARVHLVMPERNPFRDEQTEASASVVLQLNGSRSLGSDQIEGITALVAGAVESMTSDQVTILDTRGNMLSDPDAGNTDVTLTSNQLRLQREVEQHLAQNGQSMLDRVLGPGNSIVRVSAALDFSRTISESATIDPESATVISEERLEEQGAADAANSTVRNYELSRTTQRSESSVGDVARLTVSVILNHKRAAELADAEDGDEAVPPFEPRDAEQLQEIENLVKNAVGFSPQRGDQFALHQTRFDTSMDDEVVTEMQRQHQQQQIQLYLRYGLMALALVLGLWLLRSASRRLTTLEQDPLQIDEPLEARSLKDGSAEQAEDEEEMVLVDDIYTSKLSAEAKARLKAKHLMYEEIQEQVNERPEQTAEIIRSWISEDQMNDAGSKVSRN